MSTSGEGPDRRRDSDEFGSDLGEWRDLIERAVDRSELSEVFEAVEDILAMEPDTRFTESAKSLHDVFTDSDADFEESVGGSSPISPEMYRAFDEVWKVLQRIVLNELKQGRSNEIEHLLLGMYLEKAHEAFIEIDRRLEQEERVEPALSTFIALNSRLIELAFEGNAGDEAEMFRDVLRADYYLSQGKSALLQHPSELSDEAVRESVLLEGAVLAYDRLDISLGRGAELADVSRGEFEQALIRHDIEPRTGPSTLDEYVEESSLFSDDE